MIKPIMPGCLAIVIPHQAWGVPVHAVTVLSCGGPKICSHCGSGTKWFIKTPHLTSFKKVSSCACRLTRIDGGDPDAITEQDKEKERVA